MRYAFRTALVVIPALLTGSLVTQAQERIGNLYPGRPSPHIDRSPADLVLSPDGRWLATVNETANSVSLISTRDHRIVDEVSCGQHPVDIEFCPDSQTLVVSSAWSGEVTILKITDSRLGYVATIKTGFQPCGLAVTPDGDRAFVGLVATAQVAEIDLHSHEVIYRMDVGNWPRYLTLSHDGSRLAVGCGGDGRIYVIDTSTRKVLYDELLANGINLGHMISSADDTYTYFTWMVYRTNPINVGNLRRGWLLASRIGRVRLDGPEYREAISLDVPGRAVADPHGIVVSRDGRRLVASASGTHELLVYRLQDLPFVGAGGPGDLIDRQLQNDSDRFHRIEVGGRPMGLRIADDNQTVYVANYLRNSVQVVNLISRRITKEIQLGGPEKLSMARQGMKIFYDGQRSLDQWYSCHSCHQNGGINSRPMDTMNDGTEMTLKTVLPLYNVTHTRPWTWHGWQDDLESAVHKSLTSTMLGKTPNEQDTLALLNYLKTLKTAPNPFRKSDGSLTDSALRGQQIFESRKAG